MDPLLVASGTISGFRDNLGFRVFLSLSSVIHLRTEPNGPSFISEVYEKSRSGTGTVKETGEPILYLT